MDKSCITLTLMMILLKPTPIFMTSELIENRNVERYGNTAIFLCTSIKVFVYEIKIIQRFKRL